MMIPMQGMKMKMGHQIASMRRLWWWPWWQRYAKCRQKLHLFEVGEVGLLCVVHSGRCLLTCTAIWKKNSSQWLFHEGIYVIEWRKGTILTLFSLATWACFTRDWFVFGHRAFASTLASWTAPWNHFVSMKSREDNLFCDSTYDMSIWDRWFRFQQEPLNMCSAKLAVHHRSTWLERRRRSQCWCWPCSRWQTFLVIGNER